METGAKTKGGGAGRESQTPPNTEQDGKHFPGQPDPGLGRLIQVWWKDARANVEKQIPLEVQIKQLGVEIDKIDKDIKKNLSALAAQEVDCQMLEERVNALRASRKQLREPELKAKEQLLADKKRTLEAAYQRISAMRDLKEQLRVTVARLETCLETLRLKQMEAKVDLDDSQVGECIALIAEIKELLRRNEVEYRAVSPILDREPRTTEEILKSARQALQEIEKK